MKIAALRLFNVKRFADRGVAIENIDDGVNVLCAANEHGKSTSFEALHTLFFRPHTAASGEAKELRPYSGGSPLVEVDVATAKGRFRITKQYFGGKFARVVDLGAGNVLAQADEAENFIASLVNGGAAGPAGLLWVRQGVTGIEKRSGKDEENEKQVRTSLLESVQGEVEAVTGGRRMAVIMQAVEADLTKLVTKGGKPRGDYAIAIDTRDRLDAERQKLWADVTSLRDALDRRGAAQKRLAELEEADEARARQSAIETAQAAVDGARMQAENLKTAEAEWRLARARCETATSDLETFRTAAARALALRESLAGAGENRNRLEAKRREAAASIDAARAEADAADARERDARAALARAEAVVKAREDAQRLAELRERLAGADDLRGRIEQQDARLALTRIPAKAVEELQALEIEIVRLRAIEQVSQPTVAVVYESDAAPAITIDGVPIVRGAVHHYAGQARLAAPGIGEILLRSSLPAGADDALAKALAKQAGLLASLGVEDLASARGRLAAAADIESDLRELKARLAHLAPDGLKALHEEIAARSAGATADPGDEIDMAGAREACDEAAARRQAALERLRAAEPGQRLADEAFITAQTTLATLQAELAQIDAALGPAEDRDARARRMAEDLAAHRERAADAQARVETLREKAIDLASCEAALKRACSVDQAVAQEIGRLREDIAGLTAAIGARADDAVEEKWREADEALAVAQTRVRQYAREASVLQLLQSTLETARAQARELYLKPVMTELKPLLQLLFDDVSITFDEKTLLPDTILRRGLKEDVDRLSGGMKEQLSILTRLAFARLLAKDGRPTPVILDDALVYSDDDRIEKMFDALHRQSQDQQIIVFSCRQRAFQKLGGHVLEMRDWRPAS